MTNFRDNFSLYVCAHRSDTLFTIPMKWTKCLCVIFFFFFCFFPLSLFYAGNKQTNEHESLKNCNWITNHNLADVCTYGVRYHCLVYTYGIRNIFLSLNRQTVNFRSPMSRCEPFNKSYSTEGTRCNAKCFIFLFDGRQQRSFGWLNGKHWK